LLICSSTEWNGELYIVNLWSHNFTSTWTS
jgi:hypothetical protein